MPASSPVRPFLLALAVLAPATACHQRGAPTVASESARGVEPGIPGTWSGILPCADCPGILTTLTLRADSLFFQRRTYQDRPGDVWRDWGRWSLDRSGTLVLDGGTEAPGRRAVVHPDTLRLLDTEGRSINSRLPYHLVRQPTLDPFPDTLRLRGMYTHLADAGGLVECLTGRRFPVAMEGDNVALERAYLAVRTAPGEPLLVTLDGRFARRPRMEGGGSEEMIIPVRFDRVWPGGSCERTTQTPTDLTGTTWRLIELNGASGILARLEAVTPAQERVSFPTSDGGLVSGHLYGKDGPAVLLAHGGRFNKESWASQARVLTEAGFRVLAIDFRGYGESKGPGQSDPLSAPLHLDVLAGVRYLRRTGAITVSVVGGSMGGRAAADAAIAAEPGEIDRVVLLAATAGGPPEEIKGRKLFITARGDTTASGTPRVIAIRAQYEQALDPKELVILEGSAHAQFLFTTDQGERLMREILRFLSAP